MVTSTSLAFIPGTVTVTFLVTIPGLVKSGLPSFQTKVVLSGYLSLPFTPDLGSTEPLTVVLIVPPLGAGNTFTVTSTVAGV